MEKTGEKNRYIRRNADGNHDTRVEYPERRKRDASRVLHPSLSLSLSLSRRSGFAKQIQFSSVASFRASRLHWLASIQEHHQ